MIKYEICPICRTINAVNFGYGFILPKMCKCIAEERGEEWVTDEELIKVFEELENERREKDNRNA